MAKRKTEPKTSKAMLPHAQAKCITCKHQWWVGPYDVEPGDMPRCPKEGCFGIGVSTGKAELRLAEVKK